MPKKEKQLRVFFNSNSPWSTSGYGQQMAELLPLLVSEGYPTAMCSFYGLQGGKIMIDGVLHYPTINHTYGSDALVLHARDFKADVVFSLQDVWILHPNDLQQVNRWIPIVPVDSDPVTPEILDKLKFAYRIITYSKFGQEQLRKQGLYSTYIPHTVNTDIFKPMDKAERKKSGGIPPDTFVFGMVAANKDVPPRKSFQEVLEAFLMFLQQVPKSILYIHTNPDFPGGFPIKTYAQKLGIQNNVLFPDPYAMNYNTAKEQMNLIYNTFDVLLSPSRHEGFCVPIIEAMSCGVPVIANDWTSMRELVEDGVTGYKTKVLHKPWIPVQGYTAVPDPKDLFAKMMQLYTDDREKMGRNGRKFVIENYDTNGVFQNKWVPFLEKIEREVYPDIAKPTK